MRPQSNLKAAFVASNGWLTKFMKQNNLSMQIRTAKALKDHFHHTTKLVKYVIHVPRLPMKTTFSPDCIIAMNEIAVWSDKVGNVTIDTTETKNVPLKSTGNKKVKVSICLTTKADGTKLKSLILFQCAKHEATPLNEQLNLYVVASSSNSWMNEEPVSKYLTQFLEMFSFQKFLFAWDTVEAHMTKDVSKLLEQMITDNALIPGGRTKYAQVLKVVWNKPFKGHLMECYDEWLASGILQYTEAGNMKIASRHLVFKWILESWNQLEKNLIIKSFKSCGLNLKTNGSEYHLLYCFKEGKPCARYVKEATESAINRIRISQQQSL